MTVVVVISILAIMGVGVAKDIQRRAEHAKCAANLRSLYAAANVYVQDNSSWPQVDYRLLRDDETAYYKSWMQKLEKYGLAQINWLCPTIQREMGNPDMKDPQNLRIDYIASPFDDRPIAPFEYPHQPWFAERGDPHGKGNLIIMTNGQVVSLRELLGIQSN